MNPGVYDIFPDQLGGDMGFGEGFPVDAKYFHEASLDRTPHSTPGPVLPPSNGFVNWLHEAEAMKKRAGGMMASPPAWADHHQPAPSNSLLPIGGYSGSGDDDGTFSPHWWCSEAQQQLRQDPHGMMPSWGNLGPCCPVGNGTWPPPQCAVCRRGDGLLSAAMQHSHPLAMNNPYYPFLDDQNGSFCSSGSSCCGSSSSSSSTADSTADSSPYPGVGAAGWTGLSPSLPYVFPNGYRQGTMFPDLFSPSLDSLTSAASPSAVSDLDNGLHYHSTLSDSTTITGAIATVTPCLSPAQTMVSSPASAGSSSPGCKRRGSAAKGKSPGSKARLSKARRRLPGTALPQTPPSIADEGGSSSRRSSRHSARAQTEACKASPTSSAAFSSPHSSTMAPSPAYSDSFEADSGAATSFAASPATFSTSPSPSSSVVTIERVGDGPPYGKIDQMDPANRQILEATLLRDRGNDGSGNKVPYSVIMHKLRNLFRGAEETLRGHHRKLLLPKEQRVRKPVWQPRDVALLREAVAKYCETSPKRKISWTAVSQYLQDKGASYRFGITACSRKWKALQTEGQV